MSIQEEKKLCKFQNAGYCKYLEKCRFRHVTETCQNAKCLRKQCYRRHPKRCKFFFLKRYCKFNESCCYSHDVSEPKNDELLEKLKEDLENRRTEN